MDLEKLTVEAFLIFCRIGACFMIVPGLSSARVPVRIRLYLALVIAIAIAPVVGLGAHRSSDVMLLRMIISESLVGFVIGAIARLLIDSIEFFGSAISNYIGLSGISGGFDDGHPQPAIAMLLSTTALLLLIIMDFPLHLISSLARSYGDLPLGVAPDPAGMLRMVTTSLAAAFLVGAQISAPFVVYAIIINAMFGILGRLVPQLPSYFVSIPFAAFGGLALLLLVMGQLVAVLVGALSRLSLP